MINLIRRRSMILKVSDCFEPFSASQVRLEQADLDASEYNDDLAEEWPRGLSDPPQHCRRFFSTWCPKGTSIQKLVSVEGRRWAIVQGQTRRLKQHACVS